MPGMYRVSIAEILLSGNGEWVKQFRIKMHVTSAKSQIKLGPDSKSTHTIVKQE